MKILDYGVVVNDEQIHQSELCEQGQAALAEMRRLRELLAEQANRVADSVAKIRELSPEEYGYAVMTGRYSPFKALGENVQY